MLKRSQPPTPTYKLLFDYSDREFPGRASLSPCRPTLPIYSSLSSNSRDAGSSRQLGIATSAGQKDDSEVPQKRRRSSDLIITMNNSTSLQKDTDTAMHSPQFQPQSISHTDIPASSNGHSGKAAWEQPSSISEKDIAGPSRLALASTQGESSRDVMGSRLGNASSGLSSRMRKKPAKLALASPKPASDTLQVHEISLGSRSVPSSPMVHSRAATDAAAMDTDDGREQLRDSLRGTPRRRPSVPFGLRMVKLPSLTIPPKSARLSQEGPPPIWQDPSEHILSGDGSSLQHARSVYASGPIEVLPGLFLGDEFNACDDAGLARLGITTIINVAKETTLPFQADADSEQLDAAPSAGLHRGMQKVSLNDSSVATPTSASSVARRQTPARERFYTPITSMHPEAIFLSPPPPMPGSMTPNRAVYLRDISSTPNLHSQYDAAGSARCSPDSSSSSPSSRADSAPSSPEMQMIPSLSLSHRYSSTNLSTTTPSSNGAETAATSATSSSSVPPSIMLPTNAVALNVAPSPQTGRPHALRYIKLPWTHDETDLAGSRPGGFVTGCALIADALGIDVSSGQRSRMERDDQATIREGVLVHCQCGVSRSATLVIAFVMQAAAYGYDFDKTQALTGMHDCYEMVKELSSSISPNCSLIYQLVEWERQLSTSRGDGYAAELHGDPSALNGDRKWGNEALNEEDWTKMRMDEEAKEREEEEKSRNDRLEVARAASQEKSRREKEASAKQPSSSSTLDASPATGGLGARRRRPTPSLNLASSAKSTVGGAEGDAKAGREDVRDAPIQVVPVDDAGGLVEDVKHLAPASNGAIRRVRLISPSMNSAGSPSSGGSNGSGTSTLLASNHSHHPFGVAGQTAAERRNKHKRTFSKELPGWNRSSTLAVTAPSDE